MQYRNYETAMKSLEQTAEQNELSQTCIPAKNW
jgi:hypothetical protein